MSDLPITFPATGASMAPTVDELMKFRLVAAGKEKPDLIIRGGKVLALHIGEVLEVPLVRPRRKPSLYS